MINEMQDFYEKLKNEGIIFSFSGPISQNLLEGIGATLRQKMSLEETSTNITQKVFSIFVELMQNVINYSAEGGSAAKADPELSSGILVIGKKDDQFYIKSGNYISRTQKEFLDEKLPLIQGMNKDELKKYYKKKRREDAEEGSKGAGLGFIEMARKASRPIEYNILPASEDETYFFVVNVVI
ncbi:MAG: SiaB family protein kinase [Desulfonatronovibrio sp.]|nr:SiaB family protein kinase [Desulfovibrionales bacterium]